MRQVRPLSHDQVRSCRVQCKRSLSLTEVPLSYGSNSSFSSSSSSFTFTSLYHISEHASISRFLIPFASSPKKSPPPPPRSPLEEPELREHVPRVAALPLAHAGRDPLHLPLYVGTALATEVHPDHAGLVGYTATPVRAHAAVGGPEFLGAGAARQMQLLRLLGLKFRPAGLPLWDLVRAKEVQQLLAYTWEHLSEGPLKQSTGIFETGVHKCGEGFRGLVQ